MEEYKKFAYDKNCTPIINVLDEVDRDIRTYCDAEVLCITQIYSDSISDMPLVYHAYLVDMDNLCVRLMCSISSYRHLDSKIQHDIGRLNRLLHFEDIKHFKTKKLKLYDWGGVNLTGLDEDVEKVRSFKMKFSKKIMKYYYISNPQKMERQKRHLFRKKDKL